MRLKYSEIGKVDHAELLHEAISHSAEGDSAFGRSKLQREAIRAYNATVR